MIDLTEYTMNTGTDTDIEVIDFARAAYRELPAVADWKINDYGMAVLTHDNGGHFIIDLVTTDGEITDWCTTREDEDGDIYDEDGGPVNTTADLAALVDKITRWAAK